MVNKQKEALQSLWNGTCSIYVQKEYQNPITKRTEFGEIAVCENEPCKLSYMALASTSEKDDVTTVNQVPKLFLSNAIDVLAGSKIIVTQNGKTITFEKSGEPAIFSNHQELTLQLFKGFA
jgi:hypothetical protein